MDKLISAFQVCNEIGIPRSQFDQDCEEGLLSWSGFYGKRGVKLFYTSEIKRYLQEKEAKANSKAVFSDDTEPVQGDYWDRLEEQLHNS